MVDEGTGPGGTEVVRTPTPARATGRPPTEPPLLAARLLILVHVVAWSAAALPPQLTLRSLILPWVATAAAAVLASLPVSAPLRRPAIALAVASALGAVVAVWAEPADAPETTVLAAGTAVMLAAIHLVAFVGLRADPRPAIVQLTERPLRRSADHPWPFAVQLALLADLGLVLGAAFTGLATIGGGFVTAGAAILGWIVLVGALGAAALEVGVGGPAMLSAAVGATPSPGDPPGRAVSQGHVPDRSAKMPG